ncbi:MAG: MaoC/PaaZ C-terminal domain-containing protein [Gammaproteobacteria bacterium]|nr:MaoC/PaaZ C-terminal domain-containing protein [Gammaproteobacteria bacterium]MDH5619235.1 MaoC/PaaZ C-terminal domain-containing protein [Gammaproteobacteria bacterium]
MALDYDTLMAKVESDLPFSYTDADSMLYALAVGMGQDPLDTRELPYVYEQGAILKTLPTLATVLVPEMFPVGLGWDYSQILHSEQRLRLYRPLPPAADLLINKRVVDAFDRGPKLGALILLEAEGRLASDDTAIFNMGCSIIARGDGGFGGPRGRGIPPHRAPHREPDLSCDIATRSDQALLYRLTGDRNPLHADPARARAVGFNRPILHGLCTFGVACKAVLQTICDYDHTLIEEFDARFSAPVLPGDTITTDMWQDGNVISFSCSVKARNETVLRNGKCTLAV